MISVRRSALRVSLPVSVLEVGLGVGVLGFEVGVVEVLADHVLVAHELLDGGAEGEVIVAHPVGERRIDAPTLEEGVERDDVPGAPAPAFRREGEDVLGIGCSFECRGDWS